MYMMIHKKDIPLISHAQAAEIDRELEETYGGGAKFPSLENCIYGAYRQKGSLHIVKHYLYDAYGNRHDSISNLGLHLDYEKDIYHITLNVSDERNSFSKLMRNHLGMMSRQQKLTIINMAKTSLSDVFKRIDYGESTKNFSENVVQ